MTEVTRGAVWDLTSFFPEFRGPEMIRFRAELEKDLADLQRKAAEIGPLSAESSAAWESVLLAMEDLSTRYHHIGSYVGCLGAAHSDRTDYSQEEASLARLGAEFSKLGVELQQALKVVDDETFDAFAAREALAPVAHSVRRARESARFTMSREEERLAADLGVDGIHAWGRLYDRISGTLEFDMIHPDGRKERLPISQWRALMANADRRVGRAAFESGNRAWAGIEDVCAAALNALAGTRLTLNCRRGREHFLDPALFQAAIRRETLDAMVEAIHENLDVGREILRTKARALGREGVWFFEREAPLPLGDSTTFPWDRAVEMVGGAFESAYPALGAYFRETLEKRWVESEARPHKRPGAFCTGSPLTREQRVYMTYNGTLGDIRTLAHEVGHGWHSRVLRDLRPPARQYPMTLAETASTFGEGILAEGILGDPALPDAAKLAMLDAELSSAAVMLLDITVRFEFEKRFHEERRAGELSAARFREIMAETQRTVCGDALLPDGEDPLFWASKLHFYISSLSFYNFPYTFGFLLTRALHHRLQQEGAAFLPKYEAFLLLSGSDTVEGVVRRSLGEDTTRPEFWATSIRSLEPLLRSFRELLAAHG